MPVQHIHERLIFFLEYDTKERVELSSNEWKKSRISSNLALSQQIKNLKVNSSIINNNQSVYASDLNTLLAMDFVGSTGYMYQLEKDQHYFYCQKRLES